MSIIGSAIANTTTTHKTMFICSTSREVKSEIKMEILNDIEVKIYGIFNCGCILTSNQLLKLRKNLEKGNQYIFNGVFPFRLDGFYNKEVSEGVRKKLLSIINDCDFSL